MTGDSEKVAWPQRKEQGSRIPKLQWERRWAAEPAGRTLTPQENPGQRPQDRLCRDLQGTWVPSAGTAVLTWAGRDCK